jgi:hypothetical protein
MLFVEIPGSYTTLVKWCLLSSGEGSRRSEHRASLDHSRFGFDGEDEVGLRLIVGRSVVLKPSGEGPLERLVLPCRLGMDSQPG